MTRSTSEIAACCSSASSRSRVRRATSMSSPDAHMLRHACGYKLANDGVDTRSLQAYLGHRNIQNTTSQIS